jgi:hypothetical protein
MIRISPQQKQRAFSLFFSARKRGDLETFEPMEGTRLALDPQGVYLLAAEEEIWACHPTQGSVLVGEVKENGAASIDVEVCPNWDHHTNDWWNAAHGARNAPSLFRQLADNGVCQATEDEAKVLEGWASSLSGWNVGASAERTVLLFRW